MLLNLWNNIRGYVTIEVSGFSVERFVNLAVHKGVYIWDVRYQVSSVEMNVSVKGFRLLKSCAKKTKCKIKIKSKSGLPFTIFRYRKRKVLAFGMMFFIFVLYFLSSFIWLVEIEGNDRLSFEQLNKFCMEQGLKVGAVKHRIDVQQLEAGLRNNFSDISWVNVYIKGTRATVALRESLPKAQIIDKSAPGNILAKKDGLITNIVTSSGTPLVKQRDVVKKGDILVSGEIIVKNDETGLVKDYVRAEAEVWAKMYYNLSFDVPFTYTEKRFTGEESRGYSINIAEKNINLLKSRNSFANYDKIISRNQLEFGESYPLPVIILTELYREYVPVEKKLTLEQAKELSEKMLNGRVIREFDFEADIFSKEMQFVEHEDRLEVKAVVTTLERIDEEVEIVGANDKVN